MIVICISGWQCLHYDCDIYFRLPPPKKPVIRRLPSHLADSRLDVDSLGLPFTSCRDIFLYLDLHDVASCMLVCKEWRSLVDTCEFWCYYIRRHFSVRRTEPSQNSCFHKWKHQASECLKLRRVQKLVVDNSYVMCPFPDLWRCGLVVPYGLHPPRGNLDIHHQFVKAMKRMNTLRHLVKKYQLIHQVELCLFQWIRERMPSSREVLDIYNAQMDLVRSTPEAWDLTKQEIRSYYPYLQSRSNKPRFDFDFYLAVVAWTSSRSVLFDCRFDVIDPAPCFLLTSLSDGWMGGLIYGA